MAKQCNICRLSLAFLILATCIPPNESVKYEPTWDSLDSRPLPEWYDDAKFGIFLHWGVFSVPSFKSEWFWWYWKGAPTSDVVQFMENNYPPSFTYADFANQFKAEFYNANQWAQLFQDAGARYIVLTSKHHEGFTNWPSNYSWNWNSKDVGPNRDLVGELATAIRNKTNIHFGLYHSLFEWFNPLYLQDKANNFTTQDFVNRKTLPELYELVNNYKPEVVWSDGSSGPDAYFKSKEFLAWLYNESPVKDTVVVNDRWGTGDSCHHGGFYTCQDRYNPGHVLPHKWENAMTIDRRSWGFRREAQLTDILTIEQLLTQLITTVSCNGNLLMNVGPTEYGVIAPIYQERLLQVGSWLKVNGEAIYGSRPWFYQNDTVTNYVWYTQNNKTKPAVVYANLLSWPRTNALTLGAPVPSQNTTVTLVGYKGAPFRWTALPNQGVEVTVPPINFNDMPCQWAWVLKLTNILN